MLIYFFIFFVSMGGILVIVLRHREEIAEFHFATFMESITAKFVKWWHEEANSYFLKVLERFLRKSRILVLKIESFLFRKAHAIRGISERNGNGNGNGNGNSVTHKDENTPA